MTQGLLTPSTRFRWSQHLPQLRASGLRVEELHAGFGAYPPSAKWQRPFWGAAAIAESTWRALEVNRRADLCFLQRNLLSTLHTSERLLRRPFLFDVDDAIFLGPRGGSALAVARRASLIICGNRFLADHFANCGPVALLPTAVDTDHFHPRRHASSGRPTIGWSGSSSGFGYLYDIEPALGAVLQRLPEARLLIVSDQPPSFRSLPAAQVEFRAWTAASEAKVLHEFSVGIMPLEDSAWARGKCSFKMLTYMASGLPCVVAPVGMNAEVLALGELGLAARSLDDWTDALLTLLCNETLAARLGTEGRAVAESKFSRDRVGQQLIELIHRVLNKAC
ncbi:glycosyltransferase involved in cell wall biosynthesis [Inhella inkyongensis]|uniref:Glycosyltransferase involved in cell wall biosynthesis n=1 Tax=Inhella inkyongensis TaxID=392593 RepID=A0A840S429_9BURK|nr:glycosyltransferase family 4 protein [Inhella inkyongensis]MBB5204473.1 glycosyltransferase involved in cell wall biosynthesis [Inhella inkyongensis]